MGKTTIATALAGALARRGMKVQPFKTGPDYIDPTYHTSVTGVSSRNLDTWLISHEAVLELFHRAMAGKDIGVVEGVMGLYDGRFAATEEGSTAELAKLLGAPVLLVIDAAKAARSVAATVLGYRAFDPALNLAGVILNGIGSEAHYTLCREAIQSATGIPVVGFLPRRPELELPERHLGLVPTVESGLPAEFTERLIAQVEATLDINGIVSLTEKASPPESTPVLFPHHVEPVRAAIAVARDRAFSFYYQDSLDLLEAWGAEIVPFSPLADSTLPAGISGVYFGGGFPELYARELAENHGMAASVREAASKGMPVYAECGGLMYLGRSIADFEGREFPMLGIIPARTHFGKPRLSLGYRTVRATGDGPLLRRGEEVRGHEFHWSILTAASEAMPAYEVVGEGRREGFHTGNILASYVHLHMASRATMPRRFVEICSEYKNNGGRR